MNNFADDLVTGNYLRAPRRQFSFHDMQIGSADTTRSHAQQNMTRWDARQRSIADFQWMGGDFSGRN
jgi:hypothetical protein